MSESYPGCWVCGKRGDFPELYYGQPRCAECEYTTVLLDSMRQFAHSVLLWVRLEGEYWMDVDRDRNRANVFCDAIQRGDFSISYYRPRGLR